MPFIILSNSEIQKKIVEICDYAQEVSASTGIKNKKPTFLELFDDIKKVSTGIVSEHSVLSKISLIIKEQEHNINAESEPDPTIEYVSPQVAADLIVCSRETVYRLCRQGDLDSIMLPGHRIGILPESIDNYMNLNNVWR